MATPRGAEHRDFEQRLRRIEWQLRQVADVALRRGQLSVTEGDFLVSGGGSVVVQDGGGVTIAGTGELLSHYLAGPVAFTLGTFDADNKGAQFWLAEEDGSTNVFQLYRIEPNATYPNGYSSLNGSLDYLSLHGRSTSQISGPGGAIVSLDNGSVKLYGGVQCGDIPTTSAGANVNQNTTNGFLRVVSSSQRYKRDIHDAQVDPDAVLALRPRKWRDRAEVAADPDTDREYAGFIAEELDELGLTDFVVYDDEGRPDAIMYDRLAVPLLEVAKRQQSQIDALEDRLARLEAKVTGTR